jgi:hypothetical protein
MPKTRWLLLCPAAITVMAGYLVRPPREPFGDRRWQVDSVMVMDPNVTQYKLDEPYKVFRDGRVTFSRQEETAPLPVLRLDLTIDGEHVVIFTRGRE